MALLEHITCGLTSIVAPIDNVEETINCLTDVNPKTRKTGFQQQFEVYKSHYILSHSFNFYRILQGIVSKNKILGMRQPGLQRIWTRIVLSSFYHVKNISCCILIHLFILNAADTARVIIPQLDGYSDYINFCYIDVSISTYSVTCVVCDKWYVHTQGYHHSRAYLAGPGPMQSTAGDFWTMLWEKKSHTIVMLGELVENDEVAYSSS